MVGHMTTDDDALASAIIDQLNAELGANGVSMVEIAQQIGRPYDSTRNYLRKERTLPLGIFLELCSALGVSPEVVTARARGRL